MRLLLVEDSVALADELLPMLRTEGFACDWVVDGRDALDMPVLNDYDIAVLDLGLPGCNGLEVLAAWRQAGHGLPVLILTARDSWTDRIRGLTAGADDYLGKPFHPEELALRLRALLRRSHGVTSGANLTVKGVTLDEQLQCVQTPTGNIDLSGTEYRLLRYFMLNPNRPLSKYQLAEHLYDREADRHSNVIEVHISKLRDKLGREVIETRRGQGYCFAGCGA